MPRVQKICRASPHQKLSASIYYTFTELQGQLQNTLVVMIAQVKFFRSQALAHKYENCINGACNFCFVTCLVRY